MRSRFVTGLDQTMSKNKITKATAKVDEIEGRIVVVRGQRVMFDHELAEIYQVETRVLNQAVK